MSFQGVFSSPLSPLACPMGIKSIFRILYSMLCVTKVWLNVLYKSNLIECCDIWYCVLFCFCVFILKCSFHLVTFSSKQQSYDLSDYKRTFSTSVHYKVPVTKYKVQLVQLIIFSALCSPVQELRIMFRGTLKGLHFTSFFCLSEVLSVCLDCISCRYD